MKKKWKLLAAAPAVSLLLFIFSINLANAFEEPDTGITECYDADGNVLNPCPGPGQPYYGQDGNLLHNGMSFADNEDGTLTDNITGLLWQKTADSITRNWGDAGTYCAGLALGGLTGWRLPALVELNSVMDLSESNGNVAIKSIFMGAVADSYWTSDADADNPATKAWILNFNTTADILDNIDFKSATHYVRCVYGVAE